VAPGDVGDGVFGFGVPNGVRVVIAVVHVTDWLRPLQKCIY
jgi:hypothetical protein